MRRSFGGGGGPAEPVSLECYRIFPPHVLQIVKEAAPEKGNVMVGSVDFRAVFAHLAQTRQAEETVKLGGVNVRMVRVTGGGEGRWDSHDHSAETVVVWSGDFTVELDEETLVLSAGQCCVVPIGARHRGASQNGAEVILFQQAG